MASIQRPAMSSGSEGGDPHIIMDDRKRKRMISNRESARRSRMRKQKQIEDLTEEVSKLQVGNNQLVQTIKAKEEDCIETEAANRILRAQTIELAEQLKFLNLFAEGVRGSSVEILDPFLEPWLINNPILSIMASADMFLH